MRYGQILRIFIVNALMQFALYSKSVSIDIAPNSPIHQTIMRIVKQGNQPDKGQMLYGKTQAQHILLVLTSLSCSNCIQFKKNVLRTLWTNYGRSALSFIECDYPSDGPALYASAVVSGVSKKITAKVKEFLILPSIQRQWTKSHDVPEALRALLVAKYPEISNQQLKEMLNMPQLRRLVRLKQSLDALNITFVPTVFMIIRNNAKTKNPSIVHFSDVPTVRDVEEVMHRYGAMAKNVMKK